MLLSKEYVGYLARQVAQKLLAGEFIETANVRAVGDALNNALLEELQLEDRNSIRMEARRLLEDLLKEEAKIDAAARQKIESQRRTILEGTQEWDILYRKYYNEEVKKLGI